jgi:hypothetical protein
MAEEDDEKAEAAKLAADAAKLSAKRAARLEREAALKEKEAEIARIKALDAKQASAPETKPATKTVDGQLVNEKDMFYLATSAATNALQKQQEENQKALQERDERQKQALAEFEERFTKIVTKIVNNGATVAADTIVTRIGDGNLGKKLGGQAANEMWVVFVEKLKKLRTSPAFIVTILICLLGFGACNLVIHEAVVLVSGGNKTAIAAVETGVEIAEKTKVTKAYNAASSRLEKLMGKNPEASSRPTAPAPRPAPAVKPEVTPAVSQQTQPPVVDKSIPVGKTVMVVNNTNNIIQVLEMEDDGRRRKKVICKVPANGFRVPVYYEGFDLILLRVGADETSADQYESTTKSFSGGAWTWTINPSNHEGEMVKN